MITTVDLDFHTRCLVFFVDIANLGMANIALPTIQKALGYDEGSVQWILTAYSLTVSSILNSIDPENIVDLCEMIVWWFSYGWRPAW